MKRRRTSAKNRRREASVREKRRTDAKIYGLDLRTDPFKALWEPGKKSEYGHNFYGNEEKMKL